MINDVNYHRDIKPSNFVMGLGKQARMVFLIDYGLAKPYLESDSGRHIPLGMKNCVVGTLRFSSLNNHLGFSNSLLRFTLLNLMFA